MTMMMTEVFHGFPVIEFSEGKVIEGTEISTGFTIPVFPEVKIQNYKRVISTYTKKDGKTYMGILRYDSKSGGIPEDKKLEFVANFYKYIIEL